MQRALALAHVAQALGPLFLVAAIMLFRLMESWSEVYGHGTLLGDAEDMMGSRAERRDSQEASSSGFKSPIWGM